MGPGRAEVAQSQDHRTEEIVPFVCEDKRGWNFDKLCNPQRHAIEVSIIK